MTYSLKDRVAIVTGGSQGLGYAIAQAFVEAGAHVILCARDGKTLAEASERLLASAAPGQKVITEIADVAKPDDVERVVSRALETFSQVHILVNNAGIYGPKGVIEEVDWSAWVAAIEI